MDTSSNGADFPELRKYRSSHPATWIEYQARRTPGKIALEELATGIRRSYAEFYDRIARLTTWLLDHGIRRGDRVAVLAHNSADNFEILYACAAAGAIMVPLNWRLTPHELAAIIADCTPVLLCHDADNAATARALLTDRPMATLHWGCDPDTYEVAIRDSTPGAPREDFDDDTPWIIIYTSGTTGRPKGAVHTFRSTLANIDNSALTAAIGPDSVVLTVLPTFHVAGLHLYATPALTHGGTVLLMKTFDAAETLRLFTDHRLGVTHFCGVPTMFQFMSALPEFADVDLRPVHVAVGGSPVPPAMITTWRGRGIAMMPVYGATEAGSTLLFMPPRANPGAGVGVPVLHARASIRDADGNEVTAGTTGELWIRGPMTMARYWDKPKQTAAALTLDGWLRTGDAALVDANGIFHIVDRWKDMYISGGENVYPAEVENVLYRHPEIVLAAVIGTPHPHWGEVGAAYIVRTTDSTLTGERIRTWCRERLAAFKIPAHIHFRDDLPRNATGKIMKNQLRDPGA
ncbi:class I adenylate-forming enzyme family protein [Nocardia bovistercoris]|uniref:AMP-binding protein n=1 Tax=Nocardia bovistercoris TaxID=2785916 RepID=A0A931N5L0_9NOCA|nr:AMP-binding protein [Nocardia bovistercoris]MBH0779827.1 AMP-binding protein [Nocardia bovistercoris]